MSLLGHQKRRPLASDRRDSVSNELKAVLISEACRLRMTDLTNEEVTMADVSSAVSMTHVPWNKGKTIGAKPPLRTKHVGLSGPSFRSKVAFGTLRSSTSPSVASSVVAISSPSKLMMSRRVAMPRIERLSGKRRPVKFELTEATRRAVDGYVRTANRRPGSCLLAGRRKPDGSLTTPSMHGISGFPALAWTRTYSGRASCAEQKLH